MIRIAIVIGLVSISATDFCRGDALASKTMREGLPDIAGFALGMDGLMAEQRMKAFYAPNQRDVYFQRFKLDPAQQPFLAFATPARYGLRDNEDNITLMFSGTASGNQLLYMTRDVVFSSDQRPRLAQTVAAIKSKYGTPSRMSNDRIEYAYRNGDAGKATADCAAVAEYAAAVRRPGQGGSYEDYRLRADTAAGMSHADCDSLLVFSFKIVQESPKGANETISEMTSVSIALRNVETAKLKDTEAFNASLKSRDNRERGTGPVPKL